jgi:hypothetical protein
MTIDEDASAAPTDVAAPREMDEARPFPKPPQAEGDVCDKCDGPHMTDECPHFSKPRESALAEGEVAYDASADIYTFACPWCKELVVVRPQDVACRTFRHAEFKGKAGRFRFVNPHAPQAECERWVREDLIVGCGKPFRLEAQAKRVSKCGYN